MKASESMARSSDVFTVCERVASILAGLDSDEERCVVMAHVCLKLRRYDDAIAFTRAAQQHGEDGT